MGDLFSQDGVLNRGMNTLVNLVFVGILWIICCVPVVTFGAATTSAYYTMIKTVRKDEGYMIKNFFHSFKINFFPSTFFTIILILLGWLGTFNIYYFTVSKGQVFQALFLVMLVIIWYLISIFLYLFPIISRFEMKKSGYVKMALHMVLRHFLFTMINFVIVFAGIATVFFLPWSFFLVPGFVFYGLSFSVEQVLRKYMPKVDEDHEDAQKWYNQ